MSITHYPPARRLRLAAHTLPTRPQATTANDATAEHIAGAEHTGVDTDILDDGKPPF